MQISDLQRLLHMRAHCEAITEYLERNNYSRDAFSSDRMFFDAVSMCVLQIGELANSLSEQYRIETENEIPWKMIRGMRNALAHTYGEIDEDMLWDTVINDIPKLAAFLVKETGTE